MKWEVVSSYGDFFIRLFDENRKCLNTYKEYDEFWKEERPKPFTFMEWYNGVPQEICGKLNEQLNR